MGKQKNLTKNEHVRLLKADFWKGEKISPPPPHTVYAAERSRELSVRFRCVAWSTEFILNALDTGVQYEEGWILEVACGGSNMAEYLRRRGYKVTAIDIREFHYPKDIYFSVQDMSQLGFRSEAFKIVVVQTPYGPFRPDFLKICFAEWLRVLATNGYLIATFDSNREMQPGIEEFTTTSLPFKLPSARVCKKFWKQDHEHSRIIKSPEGGKFFQYFQGRDRNYTSLGFVFQKR